MVLSVVQSAKVDNVTINQVAVAFSSPVTAGNLIVFTWGSANAGGDFDTGTVTDTQLNTYTEIRHDIGGGGFGSFQLFSILYAKNINGGGNTVTASFGG